MWASPRTSRIGCYGWTGRKRYHCWTNTISQNKTHGSSARKRDRGGCWFCPNAKERELRHLYEYHPDLWGRMLELQAIPGKVTEKFNRTQTFADIDELFRKEDEQLPMAA